MANEIKDIPTTKTTADDTDLFEGQNAAGGALSSFKIAKSNLLASAKIAYGATSGTNTYSATMSPVVSSYTDGSMYHVRVGISSTGVVTFNLGPSAKKAFDTAGVQAQDGYFKAGVDYLLVYNSALDTGAGGFTVVNEIMHGLMNFRGSYNHGGSGLWPSSGGSGPSAAIRHGDTFVIAGGVGSLGTKAVNTGDLITTGVDAPGQTDSSWYVIPGPSSLALKADLTALDSYVNEETFATLTFASPTVWACDNRQMPLAKLTATGDFTIDMTNVKSGSQGILKVTASTVSAFTITFDTSFTNVEATTNASLLTYTFPADNGQFYFLNYVCDGTILHWIILDVQSENPIPFAQVGRAAAQSINNNDSTVFVTMDTETHDNSSIWAVSPNPTRFVIPGSGDKVATISIRAQWAANATGVRRNIPYLNGSTTGDIGQIFGNATAPINNSTHQVACAGGDYIEILCYQNSGGALSLDACGVRIQIHDR